MDRIEDLPADIRPIAERAVADCKYRRLFRRTMTEMGELYVYPTPRGIAWGINSKDGGFNIKRGVEL